MTKMFVVLENHCIDYEGHQTVKVWGPFASKEEASAFAETNNQVFIKLEGRLYNKQRDQAIAARGGGEWIDNICFDVMEVTQL